MIRTRVAPGAVAVVVVALTAGTAASSQTVDRAHLVRGLIQLDEAGLDGSRWTYGRLRGRIVLVDFWATWCAPCLRELPYLRRARARYGDEFEVLGVSLDTMPSRALAEWARRNDVEWPQIHADGGYDDPLARTFGIDRIPINLLLDPDGRLRDINVRGNALFDAIDRIRAERRTR